MNDDANENNAAGYQRVINNKATTNRSFKYNTKVTGITAAGNICWTQNLLFY